MLLVALRPMLAPSGAEKNTLALRYVCAALGRCGAKRRGRCATCAPLANCDEKDADVALRVRRSRIAAEKDVASCGPLIDRGGKTLTFRHVRHGDESSLCF
jgi:hypothetical protein